MKPIKIFLLLVVLTFSNQLNAQDSPELKKITIKGYSKTQTINCEGNERIVILDDYHKITIIGHCRQLAVYGNKCTIVMETAGLISLHGNDNKVTYKVHPDFKTIVSRYGNDNTVRKMK